MVILILEILAKKRVVTYPLRLFAQQVVFRAENTYYILAQIYNSKPLNSILNEISDIAITVVELLNELTDVDVLNESEEGAEVLLDALVSVPIPFFRFSVGEKD